MDLIFRSEWTDELAGILRRDIDRQPANLRQRWDRWLHQTLNGWTSRLMVPAAFWPKEQTYLERRRTELMERWNGEKWGIITPDGVQLDTMFFPAPSEPKKRPI